MSKRTTSARTVKPSRKPSCDIEQDAFLEFYPYSRPTIVFYVLYTLADGISRLSKPYVIMELAEEMAAAARRLWFVKDARVVRSDKLVPDDAA